MSMRAGYSAPMTQVQLRGPGIYGLNTEQALAVDDPRWCTTGTNLVFDDTGRLTSRKGLNAITTTGAHSSDTEAVFEYIISPTSTEIISAAGLKLYKGTTTLTDITGTITTPTANDWQFANFNGKVVGVQQGHPPIVYSGTSFADITGEPAPPKGNCVLSAFGRLWIPNENRTTLEWSGSLAETSWGSSLNLIQVWPDGVDEIVALAEWQNQILVFGKRSILVYANPVDPSGFDFEVVDIINTGTEHRDSVVAVGNDLIFMSPDGLRSISRGIEFSTLPMTELSTHVRSRLLNQLQGATKVQADYSPEDRAYICRIEVVEANFFWYFDLGQRLPSGDLRAFEWSGIDYTSIHVAGSDNTVYLGLNGKVGDHSGYQDNGGSYDVEWLTAGSDLQQEGEKILKSARMLVALQASATIRFLWKVDFLDRLNSFQKTIDVMSGFSEWNVSEWGEDEWSGGSTSLKLVTFQLSDSGQIIQVGARTTIDGTPVAFSTIQLLAKIGRYAA